MEIALDAGAEDISEDEDEIEVVTDIATFDSVKKVFDDKRYQIYRCRNQHGSPERLSSLKERMLKPCLS